MSYEVHFRDVEGGSTDPMYNVTVLAGDDRRLDFTNLQIYWEYGVRIKAFTENGAGKLGHEITGRTDEWGMVFLYCCIAFLGRMTGVCVSVIFPL